MSRVIFIGAGGHSRVLLDVARLMQLEVVGFVTPHDEATTGAMRELPRLGNDEVLLSADREIKLVNGIGSVGSVCARRSVFDRFTGHGFSFVSIIHPSAIVAHDVEYREGAQILAGAILQTGARLGRNVLINTGAIVEHDCAVGDHVHIGPRACLSGGVQISDCVHVGIGATVIQNLTIGRFAIVGAGATVVSNVMQGRTVKGVPAR